MATPHVFNVRFDKQTWEALRDEAQQEGRSINSQLVYVLRERYAIKSQFPVPSGRKPKKGK